MNADRPNVGTLEHRDRTRCNLTREDFHPDGDESCADGGRPEDHPSRERGEATTTVWALVVISMIFLMACIVIGQRLEDKRLESQYPCINDEDGWAQTSMGEGGCDVITEDDPRWDCSTMGNGVCGETP